MSFRFEIPSPVKYTIIGFLTFLASGCAFLAPTKRLTAHSGKWPSHYYRGIYHIHSEFSYDSKATLDEIILYAQKLNLDFVIITDHNTLAIKKTNPDHNQPATPLTIFGNEISTVDGHLIALGIDKEPDFLTDSQGIIDWIHENGGYAIIAHPFSRKRPWKNWNLQNFDGIELYNFGHTLYTINKLKLAISSLFNLPVPFIIDKIRLPEDRFLFWDSLLSSRPIISALGASDAHLKLGNVPVMRGMFHRALEAVTLYVQAEKLDEKNILHNLLKGNSCTVFESLGMAHGFSFKANVESLSFSPNQVISTHLPVTFSVHAPKAHKIFLFHNGSLLKQGYDDSLKYVSKQSGVFRVEVYRKNRIWIISNPIVVQH